MIVDEMVASQWLCCGPQSSRQMNPQVNCAGGKCMAWRWIIGPGEMGYCGYIPHDQPMVKMDAVAGEGDDD